MSVGLTSIWTLKSWRNGLIGLLCSLALTNTKTLLLPILQAVPWLVWWAALLLEEARDPGAEWAKPKPVAVVRKTKHILSCISKNVTRQSRVDRSYYFLYILCAMSCLGHPSTREVNRLEEVQWRAIRMHREHAEDVQREAEGALSNSWRIKALLSCL